ncbi:STM4015 family protein [Streptomyces sp. NBC_00829]|uniref:STM4015 family protein n=1 Tax=Streptomyces sp. NBC_00829 TaxID=2903679 RepID=UPI00386E7ADD|nr:STM4015 family protein [Streptomyces sp. NBC_00829]
MTISEHLQELHGLPVFDFPDAESKVELPSVPSVAWRIAVDAYDSEEEWEDAFARFLGTVNPGEVRALIIGSWSEAYDSGPEPIVSALLDAREQLSQLRALFMGDITYEECEISWINQGHVTPLLDAFPGLLEFGVRGGQGLVFPAVRHERLRSLTIEAGGLDEQVVRGVAASDLPALEHLDLWLGTSWYGANADVSDLEPILAGTRLPALKHLALRNSEIQDEIAVAVAGAPVVARLETLDLSMGTLGDEGAEALLSGQPLTHLRKLDLHHHFIGQPMARRLATAFEADGVEVDLTDGQAGERDSAGREDRYTAVAE